MCLYCWFTSLQYCNDNGGEKVNLGKLIVDTHKINILTDYDSGYLLQLSAFIVSINDNSGG